MAFLVMGILMMIAITAASVMIFQIQMTGDIASSVPAFYAADAAAEKYLYETRKFYSEGGNVCAISAQTIQVNLDNGAVGYATIVANEFTAWGIFKSTQRQVRLTW